MNAMKPIPRLTACLAGAIASMSLLTGSQADAASAQILGWNNLGMHCMDSDYSVFSILPPYNTIESQLIVGGKLITNGAGYTVTYQAVADADGSFNSTSRGKGNFINSAFALFGASLAVDQGLPVPGPETFWMPGTNNTPQAMKFENTYRWFTAYGIPITPYDDAGRKNPYPMMRLIARDGGGTPLATNDIVLPVSDEMDCRACHASGSQAAAMPVGGWVGNANPERDYRLNILRLHDEKQFAAHTALYNAALAARGFSPQGLYHGVVADGKPVLCAACHASEALATGSYSTIPALTASVHSKTRGRPGSRTAPHARRLRQSCRLLPLPSRLRHQVPPGCDGWGDCQRWHDGHAMPELPRQHECGRRGEPHRLADGAELPELPHRHSHE
jgi:hypothetical protein